MEDSFKTIPRQTTTRFKPRRENGSTQHLHGFLLMNKMYSDQIERLTINGPSSDRLYTRLFPKKRIYREISPKFIPILAGQSNAGYLIHEQFAIDSFIENLRGENGGSLPTIENIGSYSCETECCVISFWNEGEYSPEWFQAKFKQI